jgi:hypothetical protein
MRQWFSTPRAKTCVALLIHRFAVPLPRWGRQEKRIVLPAKPQFSFHLCKKRTPLFTPRKKISNLTKLEKFAFPT